MSTATIEPESLVAAPDDHVVFYSRRQDLRLVKTPRYPIYGPGGREMGTQLGEAVQFRDGQLRVPLKGKMRMDDGREMPAVEVRDWLENHRLFSDREDGFWRIDPEAPPVSREELDALTQIALDFDEERLVAFIEQERSGWAREDLLGTAEKALERMREIAKAAAAAEQAKE